MVAAAASRSVIPSMETVALVTELETKVDVPPILTVTLGSTAPLTTIALIVPSVSISGACNPSMETVAFVLKKETKANVPLTLTAPVELTVTLGTIAMIVKSVSSGAIPSMENAALVRVAPPILTVTTLGRIVALRTTAMIVTVVSHLAIPLTETVLYVPRRHLVLLHSLTKS